MNKFEQVINNYIQLNEADMGAPAGVPGGVPAGVPGGMPGGAPGGIEPGGDIGGSALPGMPGGVGPEGEPGQGADVSSMDKKSKREADPIAYTEAMLKLLINPDEGISPEMFSSFLDTFGTGLNKVRDKEGFKRFYAKLYNNIRQVLDTKERLKDVFAQLHGTLKDVLSNQAEEPNTAQGGTGMAGPSGPGVKS